MLQEPIISFSDFSIFFQSGKQSIKGVEGINFSVNEGSFTGIVGESGSGKSITCLSILRLLKENAIYGGKLYFKSERYGLTDLLHSEDAELRTLAGKEISYIFQEPMTALNPVQTCGKQLIENIRLHSGLKAKAAREKAIELLKEVRMPDPERIFNSYPHQVSGGQRQRVMIAMAIAGNPRLLIADEPTTALDKLVQRDILELLKHLNKTRNMAVILISHDFDVIAQYTDQAIVMYRGHIVEQGLTHDILSNPSQAYTKALLACKPKASYSKVFLPTLKDFENNNSYSPVAWPETHISSEKQLEVSELGKRFKSGDTYFAAVDGVSFEVRKGETLGLIGESGSGKSTISKMLIRLEKPSSGNILFKGQDLESIRHYPRVAQMIFQDPYSSLNPSLSIGSVLEEVISLHQKLSGQALKDEVGSLLEKVGLKASDAEKYPNEFSGGQRQRICIARALAAKPEFIICDESVSALDLSVQAQILNLLKRLQVSEQLTYLFITHDMNVVRYFADRIIVLKQGKIVEAGDTATLSSNPSHDYTRMLLSE